MDELPEALNILKGDLSVISPRPQLVQDMAFIPDEQRMRHSAKPGLSGLAQVMGCNAITWEDKINWVLKYIQHETFIGDVKNVLKTVKKVFMRGEKVEETDVTLDYGDALLREGKASMEEYDTLRAYARNIITEHEEKKS